MPSLLYYLSQIQHSWSACQGSPDQPSTPQERAESLLRYSQGELIVCSMSYVCVAAIQILAHNGKDKLEEFPNSNFEPTLKALGMYWSAGFIFSVDSLQSKWEGKHHWCLVLYSPVWSPVHRCSEDWQRWVFYPEGWTKVQFSSPSAHHVPWSLNKRNRWGVGTGWCTDPSTWNSET